VKAKSKLVITITIIWVIIVVGLLCSYWMWNWQVLETVATWVLAGGVGVAIWQIIVTRENTTNQLEAVRKSTNAQIAVGLFQELRNSEAIKKLRHIYNIKHSDLRYLSRGYLSFETKEDIDYVLDRFDTLGVLVAKDLVDKQLAIEVYAGISALRCWYILHEYIEGQRKIRGYYAENYEAFVRLSLDYFEEARIEPKFYRKDESGQVIEVIDLLIELKKNELHPRSSEDIERDRKREQA